MNKEPFFGEPDIETRIEKFKAILKGQEHEEVIVQKYIAHGTPYIFKDDEDKYFDLKREIAANFSEHYNNIHMVGSAKLGFSIAPSKLWNPLWVGLHEFNIGLTDRTKSEDDKYKSFLAYFFKGWIRPDLFPLKYQAKTDWLDFFKSISYGKYGPQKITGALYHSFNFFEKYHVKNIQKLRIGDN
jgi:hypothetical protein